MLTVFVPHPLLRNERGTLLIGTKDSIPRGIRRIYKNREDPDNGEKGITELLITDLKVNPSIGKHPFDPTIPAGFTKTDDFAP